MLIDNLDWLTADAVVYMVCLVTDRRYIHGATTRVKPVYELILDVFGLSRLYALAGCDALNAVNAVEAALGRPALSDYDLTMATLRNHGKIWEDF